MSKVTSSTPRPYITVVLMAFDRREFLLEALDSVLNQTLPAEFTEILVIRNFADSPTDDELRRQSVTGIFLDDPRHGEWIATALKLGRGEVFVFLDDDDLFVPSKLEMVFRCFSNDDKLGYYHNGITYFAERNEPFLDLPATSGMPRNPRSLIQLNAGQRNPVRVREAWYGGAAFNLSSISVRRSILETGKSYLRKIRLGSSNMIFYCALLSTLNMVSDPIELTRFRIHSSNTSQSVTRSRTKHWNQRLRLAPVIIHDARITLQMLRDKGADAGYAVPLRLYCARNELLLTPASGKGSRRRALLLLSEILRYSLQLRSIDLIDFQLGIIGVFYPSWTPRWLGLEETTSAEGMKR